MLDAYSELSAATDGAVNPLVSASLSALGYDDRYSLAPGEPMVAPKDWPRAFFWSEVGMAAIEPVLVDLVLARLGNALGDVVVDAGGEICVQGS